VNSPTSSKFPSRELSSSKIPYRSQKIGDPIYEKFVSRSRKSGPFYKGRSNSIIDCPIAYRHTYNEKLDNKAHY